MSFPTTVLTVVAILGSALIAGVFFAFSSFVMRALSRLPATAGIEVMQVINVVVLNPIFLGTFAGTALVSVVVAVLAGAGWGTPTAPWILAGALSYVVGTFLVTGLGNVPLNNELAAVSASDPAAARIWARYLDRWTFLNTVRTIAAIVAVLSFTIGLIRSGGA